MYVGNILVLRKPSEDKCQGFTLLELLFTMIILGILTAFAYPNFIGQIGKAREAEVRLLMGTISRAQQAHHYEKKSFANSYASLAGGTGGFSSNYVTLPPPELSPTGNVVKHKAVSIDGDSNRVRNFSTGIYYLTGGAYRISLCQSFDVNQDVSVGDVPAADCTNNGIKLQ
jgi:prepilin-type N-terminal cleavage/methylation domain-containing protein